MSRKAYNLLYELYVELNKERNKNPAESCSKDEADLIYMADILWEKLTTKEMIKINKEFKWTGVGVSEK